MNKTNKFMVIPLGVVGYVWYQGGIDPVQSRWFLMILGLCLLIPVISMGLAFDSDRWPSPMSLIVPIGFTSALLYVLLQPGGPILKQWPVMLVLFGQGLAIVASYLYHRDNRQKTAKKGIKPMADVAGQRVLSGGELAHEAEQQSIRYVAERARHSFRDVVGMVELKARMLKAGREIRESMNRKGDAQPRNGMLLFGTPGNGKTLFAEALAGELRLPIIRFTFGNAASSWVNETTERIAAVFRDAAAQAPCILFIDEIDSFLVNRATVANGDSEVQRSVNTMLTEMVNLREKGVVLVAATNFLDRLDEAAVREGRFDYKIEITPPDMPARVSLFKNEMQHRAPKLGFDKTAVDTAARRWNGFSVARIRAVAQDVADFCAEKNIRLVSYDVIRDSLRRVQGRAGNPINETVPLVQDLAMNVKAKQKLVGLARRMEDVANIEELGGTVPKGVLFYGPPGTGKTFAVQSLAKTAGWALLITSGQELLADPSRIDTIIAKAADIRPCLVFIDEADDALQNRRATLNGHVTAKLLTALDGAASTAPDVMFVAATNFPDVMDEAAMRGGRLGEKIEFAAPDRETVVKFAQAWRIALKVKVAADVSDEWLGDVLLGLSIANLKEVLQQCVNHAIGCAELEQTPVVTRDHVTEASNLFTQEEQ